MTNIGKKGHEYHTPLKLIKYQSHAKLKKKNI